MRRYYAGMLAVAGVFLFATIARAEEPQKVTVCQLKGNPGAFDRKLIEVAGFVSHDFEDFSLFDPTCGGWFGVWLEYGGTAKSDTIYCCGPTAGKRRAKQLNVEGISIPLVEDDRFRQFDKLIQPQHRGDATEPSFTGFLWAASSRDEKPRFPTGIRLGPGSGTWAAAACLRSRK